MNREYKRYIGLTHLDGRFYRARDEESIAWAPHDGRTFPLEFDLSYLAESQEIEFLQIFCARKNIEYVPQYLRKLGRLKYLSIPSTVAERLTTENAAPEIEAIYVYRNDFSFQDQLHLENLVVLHTMALEVGFRYENFPKLQSVAMVGNKVRTLKELAKFPDLSSATLLKPHKDAIQYLCNGTMEELGFVGGGIPNLSGLELLKDLTELRLINMRKLTSINHLAASGVREVTLEGCHHVEGLAPLTRMAGLRKVTTDDPRVHSLNFKAGVEIRFVGR